jgi:hypothetical protein
MFSHVSMRFSFRRFFACAAIYGAALMLTMQSSLTRADDDVVFVQTLPISTAQSKALATCAFASATLLQCKYDGNYDRGNSAARADVAKSIYEKLNDQFDYLIIFSSFDFNLGGADAVYTSIRNDVQGIGLPLFNSSSAFGSQNKLRGIVDMGNLKKIDFTVGSKSYKSSLNILMHELQHPFGVYIKFRDSQGALSDALLGESASHWSYFADSDASLMYGADWVNENSQFRAAQVFKTYNNLDLYLAGLIPASAVTPIDLIQNGTGNNTDLPKIAAVSGGQKESISFAQILAANGARVPSSDTAPKHFRAAIIVLSRTTEPTLAPGVAINLEQFRRVAQERYAAMTRGFGTLDLSNSVVNPPLIAQPCSDALSAPGQIVVPDAPQRSGSWLIKNPGSNCNTGVAAPPSYQRETAASASKLMFLSEFPEAATQVGALDTQLRAQMPSNTDQAAWLLRAQPNHPTALAVLKSAVQPDGGFALTPWSRASVSDTALALSALPSSETQLRAGALAFLRANKVAGNAFPMINGGAGVGHGRRAACLYQY